ncbi:flagellin [Devosia sp. MC532]|uniref:flagellin n=1 Tax=Devosia sp. MC532 TaxID=2799788 RepID=UPI0018F2F67B|nr:flagellin [Devosia sp. MC532]MBJ7578456.1 flagellin [Devosia sp. MC532]
MAMRVATFALNDRMLAASLQTQSRMAEMQMQQASGIKSNALGEYGASGKVLIDLEISLARSQTYTASAQEASSRVAVMYGIMDTVNELLSNFRVALAGIKSVNSDAETRASLANNASFTMTELGALLNSQYEGRYLFGGSATTTLPVDLANYTLADPTQPYTDYYMGNDALASAQVSAEQSVSYGVAASDPAFEKAFRALSIIADTNGVFGATTVDDSLNLIMDAINNAAGVQGTLSLNAAALERSVRREEDFQEMFKADLSGVRDVDVTQVAVRLTSYEMQLQASFATMAKVSNLSLLDYLR